MSVAVAAAAASQYGSTSSLGPGSTEPELSNGRYLQQQESLQSDVGGQSMYHCVSAEDENSSSTLSSPSSGSRGWRYQRYALVICVVSLFASISLGVLGFVGSIKTDNDAAFSFALNCMLDFFSTTVVLWRFWPRSIRKSFCLAASREAGTAEFLPGEAGQRGRQEWWLRERRATIGIAILFILAFVAVVCKALADIVNIQVPSSGLPTVVVAAVSSVLFLTLAWVKVRVAGVLHSPAMRSDGVNSLAGAVISLGVIAGWLVTHWHRHVWYVDAFVALVVGLGMFVYAIRVLVSMMSKDARNRPVY